MRFVPFNYQDIQQVVVTPVNVNVLANGRSQYLSDEIDPASVGKKAFLVLHGKCVEVLKGNKTTALLNMKNDNSEFLKMLSQAKIYNTHFSAIDPRGTILHKAGSNAS